MCCCALVKARSILRNLSHVFISLCLSHALCVYLPCSHFFSPTRLLKTVFPGDLMNLLPPERACSKHYLYFGCQRFQNTSVILARQILPYSFYFFFHFFFVALLERPALPHIANCSTLIKSTKSITAVGCSAACFIFLHSCLSSFVCRRGLVSLTLTACWKNILSCCCCARRLYRSPLSLFRMKAISMP